MRSDFRMWLQGGEGRKWGWAGVKGLDYGIGGEN